MIECAPDLPGLTNLFDPHIPNNPALWSVFSGKHAGRAVVDDLRSPKQCLLRTEAVLTYSSSEIEPAFLEEAITYFCHAGPIWLVRYAGAISAPPGKRIMQRLEYFDYDPQSPILHTLRSNLPAGCEMRPMNREILERCEWRDDMIFYSGSLDNFLKHDLGLCLMRGDEIIVETYASAFGGSYAEIGAITHEIYRGKGYASIACSYLIQAVEQRGYHAYWSCDADNLASSQVARKLGFKIERPYEIIEYVSEGTSEGGN
jgi:GNAT superfamily N-acetyltransferase